MVMDKERKKDMYFGKRNPPLIMTGPKIKNVKDTSKEESPTKSASPKKSALPPISQSTNEQAVRLMIDYNATDMMMSHRKSSRAKISHRYSKDTSVERNTNHL